MKAKRKHGVVLHYGGVGIPGSVETVLHAGASTLSWDRDRNRRPRHEQRVCFSSDLRSSLLSMGLWGVCTLGCCKYSCKNTRMYKEKQMDAFLPSKCSEVT